MLDLLPFRALVRRDVVPAHAFVNENVLNRYIVLLGSSH
jgi:hypothetical protein